jgi:hypothetical protein
MYKAIALANNDTCGLILTTCAALGRVHRRHAGVIHARRERTGHFWHLIEAGDHAMVPRDQPAADIGARLYVMRSHRPGEVG